MPAELLHVVHAVRAQQQRAAVGEVALHPRDALLLERLVADGEHLVGDQHVGRERGRDREAQAHDHARRVVLDRLVDVLADVGERDDRVALRGELRGREAHQRRGEVDVLRARVLGMEARSPARAARRRGRARRRVPRVGLITPATTLSSVDLPAPFSPMTPSDSPALHRERHAVERAEHVRRAAAAQQLPDERDAPAARLDLRVVLADAVEREERRGHAAKASG